jgi:predicted Zn-dependent protease
LNTSRVSEAKDRLTKKSESLPKDSLDFEFAKARLAVLLSKQPEHYLDEHAVGSDVIGEYQKALILMRTQNADAAIKILNRQVAQHQHPWLQLALAEAYTINREDKKALKILSALAALYPNYLPVTIAYTSALNDNKMPEKSIPLLKKQLQINDNAIVYEALAKAYYANGQISAALESTGNQYARQGYIELAIQQYDNALKQEDISPSTKQRLETAKQELKKVMQQYKDQF